MLSGRIDDQICLPTVLLQVCENCQIHMWPVRFGYPDVLAKILAKIAEYFNGLPELEGKPGRLSRTS